MNFKQVEDIKAWQQSMELAVDVFEAFRLCRDWSFNDQIRRASVSVSSNITEGFERDSNKEFVRFLFIAKGSCSEVRSLLCLALRFKYINEATHKVIYERSNYIIRMLSKLIFHLRPP
ncbi:MAG: four helix bundle protein [Patescibacteria group bacterium]